MSCYLFLSHWPGSECTQAGTQYWRRSPCRRGGGEEETEERYLTYAGFVQASPWWSGLISRCWRFLTLWGRGVGGVSPALHPSVISTRAWLVSQELLWLSNSMWPAVMPRSEQTNRPCAVVAWESFMDGKIEIWIVDRDDTQTDRGDNANVNTWKDQSRERGSPKWCQTNIITLRKDSWLLSCVDYEL